ncbi:hypothetical protein OGAPHI_004524 [Ogataea philodendri]|uniref:Uncharacterized protein n=1 Tax=Ogataea philodendri TaxID=1378263 RepID=A0A9P8T5Q7_9ASCO|nr:uncharacterized protein OGAPHI_004524 [Ogataea philodendri]KAH3666335.1 hypothetical protein OGAPHI_004524 [Ogataea philodendri]
MMQFQRKRRKLDLKIRPPEDRPVVGYHQIGSQDLGFVDKEVQQTYNYRRLEPGHQARTSERGSLRALCSSKIAYSADSLSRNHIDATSANWSVWKSVWNYILKYEKDSPAIFNLFAGYFSNEPDFVAHLIPASWRKLDNYKRGVFVELNSINRKHRMETFYPHVSLDLLFCDLEHCKFNNLLILSLQGIDLSQRPFVLNKLSNLRYLNVSHSNVSDQMVKTWSISMKDGNVRNLKCLILSSNPVQSIDCLLQTSLTYIETNINIQDDHWRPATDSNLAVLPDGLKFQRLAEIENGSIILDYKVATTNSERSVETLWKNRFQGPTPDRNVFRFVRTKSVHKKPKKQVKAKPRQRAQKLDLKTFFDI